MEQNQIPAIEPSDTNMTEAHSAHDTGTATHGGEWLAQELMRIAEMDPLMDGTELDKLKQDAPLQGLKLDLRTCKARLRELRKAAKAAELAGVNSKAAIDDLVDRLNAQFFVFLGGDKVTIGSWQMQEGRRVLVQRSQQDFGLLLANEQEVFSPQVAQFLPAATAWLRHPGRREVKGFVFESDPEQSATAARNGFENLFEGFAVVAKRGDIGPFLRHLKEVIVAEEPEHQRETIVDYVLDCLAHLVQRPGIPLKVALLLRGQQGAGKSFLTDVVTALFRGNTFETSHSDDIVGRFNTHLLSTALVVGDEAVFAGSRKDADTMKRLITQDTLRIEGKHKDVLNARNRMSFLLTSNHSHAAHIEPRDRRFFVLNVSDCRTPRREHEAYWSELWAWAHSEDGKAALLHALMERDISAFDAQRDRPTTKAHLEQVLQSLSGVKAWYFEEFVARLSLCPQLQSTTIDEKKLSEELRAELGAGEQVLRKGKVYNAYKAWAGEQRYGERPLNASAFWKEMREMLGDDAVGKRRIDGKSTHVFILPDHAERVRRFTAAMGHDADTLSELIDALDGDTGIEDLQSSDGDRVTTAIARLQAAVH